MANTAVAKDHLVPPTSCMNLWWLSYGWFNLMQFVDVFIPLILPFGFDHTYICRLYGYIDIRVGIDYRDYRPVWV